MKPTSYILALLLASVGFWIAGCGKPAVLVQKPPNREKPSDPWLNAKETFRQAENTRAGDEWTRYRGGCEQLKNHFAKPDVVKNMRDLSAKHHAFLDKEVQLTAEELLEVESISFTTADAHYLDECYLLADAAKSLDAPGLAVPEIANLHFRWVMRNVLPHEQGDSWTPPAFTLRRGCGSPLERALVFLALLRQAQFDGWSIDGCLLVVPEPEPKQFLVGVLDRKSNELYLFDPRLGIALAGRDGKSVLTLKEAVATPDLLKPSSLAPAQVQQLEAWLVCPFHALSARMLELQKGLAARGESLALHLDAPELAKDIAKAAGRPAKVWNAPVKDKSTPNSPTRSLRRFLSKQEGGVDETNRALRFAGMRVPLQSVLVNYAQINLTGGLFPPFCSQMLLGLTETLVNQYDLQAREMYLRGQYEWVVRRHERLNPFAKNDALVGLLGEPKFVKEAEEFRQNANKAFAASQEAGFMNFLLNQDQFLRAMVETSKEKFVDQQQEMKGLTRVDRQEMTVITRVIAVGIRDHFAAELARTQAAMNHEKAEHAEALVAAHGEAPAALRSEARDAWIVAKNSWEKTYLENFPLHSLLKQKLKQLQQVPPNRNEEFDQYVKQLSLLEVLHLDVQKYFRARLRLVECTQAVDGNKAARELRLAIKGQIETLEKDGLLNTEIKRLQSDRRTKNSPIFEQRLELLARDWTEKGNYYWMKQEIEQSLAK